VTRPRFLLEVPGLGSVGIGAELVLDGEEGRHAAAVRRIRPGERIDVTDGAGRVATCEVVGAERDRLALTVIGVATVDPPRLRFVLVQALAKGGRDEAAVEAATEVGVDAVVPWQAARSVVVWAGERGERSRRRWEATARAAAKQSRRAHLPEIRPTVDGAGLARLVRAATMTLVLHEDATEPLTGVVLPEEGEVLLVVGPEGGLDPAEFDLLGAAGGRAVRLGSEVLRTSTAGPAAVVALAVRSGRW